MNHELGCGKRLIDGIEESILYKYVRISSESHEHVGTMDFVNEKHRSCISECGYIQS